MTQPQNEEGRGHTVGVLAIPSARAAGASAPEPAVASPPFGSITIAEAELIAREAFKAGWKERNRTPGLRRQVKRSFDNLLRSAIGGGRFNDVEYVPDTRTYRHSIWQRSEHRAALSRALGEQP